MFDRLPTPYGLVRLGVAPDHQKIKSVTAVFDKVAAHPRFRFFGGVELGRDLTVDDLRRHYHQILYTPRAPRPTGGWNPGEGLRGSHPATEFVAWYNGHPDFRDHQFDLSQERAAIVGVGNVAVDVARVLSRSVDELAKTDIADYALDALRQGRIRRSISWADGARPRRPSGPEIRELEELQADLVVLPEEVELDPLSRQALESSQDRATSKKVEILQEFARRPLSGKPRRLTVRFLVSPVEVLGGSSGEVTGLRLVRSKLVASEAGSLQAKPTGEFEELPVGLVFRSVGYKGVPLPGVPFHELGRDPQRARPRAGPRDQEAAPGRVRCRLDQARPHRSHRNQQARRRRDGGGDDEGRRPGSAAGAGRRRPRAIARLVSERQPDHVSYEDWRRLDQLEVARGRAAGRPRVKFTRVKDMLAALGR